MQKLALLVLAAMALTNYANVARADYDHACVDRLFEKAIKEDGGEYEWKLLNIHPEIKHNLDDLKLYFITMCGGTMADVEKEAKRFPPMQSGPTPEDNAAHAAGTLPPGLCRGLPKDYEMWYRGRLVSPWDVGQCPPETKPH